MILKIILIVALLLFAQSQAKKGTGGGLLLAGLSVLAAIFILLGLFGVVLFIFHLSLWVLGLAVVALVAYWFITGKKSATTN